MYECKKVNAIINQYFQTIKQTFLSNWFNYKNFIIKEENNKMQHDDIIEITTTRRIINQLPIRSIYEYEENIEVLITNSKPEKEDNYKIFSEPN